MGTRVQLSSLMVLDAPYSAWSFLVVDESRRQHRGNEGYNDDLDRHYSWDSTVPNHSYPMAGDLCVVRDSQGALGLSRIERVSRTEGVTKPRLRCRRCGSTAIKARVTLQPRFRCGACGSVFTRARTERLRSRSTGPSIRTAGWALTGR